MALRRKRAQVGAHLANLRHLQQRRLQNPDDAAGVLLRWRSRVRSLRRQLHTKHAVSGCPPRRAVCTAQRREVTWVSIRTRRASSHDPPAHAAHVQQAFRWRPARASRRWCSTVTGVHSSPYNSNTFSPLAGVGYRTSKGVGFLPGVWTSTRTGLYTWDGLGIHAGVVAREGSPWDRRSSARAGRRTVVRTCTRVLVGVVEQRGWRRRTIVDTMPFFYWEVCEESSAASTGVVCDAVGTGY
jgi:hypothetical protein